MKPHTPLSLRLEDPEAAGLHPIPREGRGAVEAAAAATDYALVKVDLSNCRTKPELLACLADALGFPDWFGHNWDALADCLADMNWLPAPGYVMILEKPRHLVADPRSGFATALAILEEAAGKWAEIGIPMWIFVEFPDTTENPGR